MATKIKITNPDISQEAKTYLVTDYVSGTNLGVRSSNGFTNNYYGVVGEPGQEQTECQLITGTSSSDALTIYSALNYSHPKSTPVYQSQWDKIAFEQKISGGSYAAISGSPFDIDWDDADNETLITVSNGATTDTYRWRFYNSTTYDYSDYSDALAGTGLDRYQLGHVIDLVRKNPVAANIDDDTMIQYANDYQDLVYDEIPKAWWFTKQGTRLHPTASTYQYSVTENWSDFLAMKYLNYNYISGDIDETYPLTWATNAEFYNMKADADQPTDDYAKYWTLLPPDGSSAKGYIGIHPTPKTATPYIIPIYYYELTALDSFGDTIVIPYSKGYIDYILYRIYDDIKSDSNNADKMLARVNRSIVALKRRDRRQLGQQEFTRFRGHRGWSGLFGEYGRESQSDLKELYW